MTPLHTEVSEESRTNKKQMFFKRTSYLLFLNTEINYNILHTKITASVIMQRHHFIQQPSLFAIHFPSARFPYRISTSSEE